MARPAWMDKLFFVGAHDVAAKRWTDLRKPEYRSMYEGAFVADVQRYGRRPTLEDVESVLKRMKMDRTIHKPDELVDGYPTLSETAQDLFGERLPTTRFWFFYKGTSGNLYVVGGVPDGVADDYCYEFKAASGNDNGFKALKQAGIRQAQLYAHAWKRPKIRVQLVRFKLPGSFPFRLEALPEPERVPVIERPADLQEVAGILDRMDNALNPVISRA